MKKVLIISLVVVVAGLSVLTACGQQLSESDIATIQGLVSRADSLESQVASLQGSEEDIAQLQAELDAIRVDLNDLKPSNSTVTFDSLAALIAALDTRIEALEGDEPENGEEPPSGEVTVILDVDADPLQFMSGATSASQVFPIKIINGTGEYQQVTYNITLRCVSTDHMADVNGGYSMTVNAVPMVATPVPGDTGCQWLYFLWTDPGSIPVAPSKTVTVYTTLNDFATSSGFEVWEVTLAGVNVTEL